MIRFYQATALVIGGTVLVWQGWNAHGGRFVHRFLVADLIIGLVLIAAAAWPGEKVSAVGMLVGFAALTGVFLSATTGGLLVDGYQHAGTILTTLGLVPCLACVVGLGRWLVSSEGVGPPD